MAALRSGYNHNPPPHHPHHHPLLDVRLANGNGHITGPPPPPRPHSHLRPELSPLRLPPREDSTRVQLQRQRLKEQHSSSAAAAAATALVVSKNIPGLRTSAAFFASLRTNLRLHASPPPSPLSTPPSMRGSTTSLPPPSPLSQPVGFTMADPSTTDNDTTVPSTATASTAPATTDPAPPATAADPLAGVPDLKTYITTDEDEKIAALKLVADSIAQMRQTANNALIAHPLNMAILVALVALWARFIYERQNKDPILAGFTSFGIVMAALLSTRIFTKDYMDAAEALKWTFLDNCDVLVTKFGDEVIGTVVMEWVSGESSTRQKRKKAWRVEIKAWTVRLKYRKKGVGAALLEEAVKEAKTKGAEVIEFADDHVNSKRVLWRMYNGVFDRREQKARDLLDELVESSSPNKSKRK